MSTGCRVGQTAAVLIMLVNTLLCGDITVLTVLMAAGDLPDPFAVTAALIVLCVMLTQTSCNDHCSTVRRAGKSSDRQHGYCHKQRHTQGQNPFLHDRPPPS